jgi:tetraacyldisaccharide 4'-kinase
MMRRSLLLPFVPVYGAGVVLRNVFFDVGILRTQKVAAPVISVGNLSAGGSGKTPFVELLAKRLMHAGRKVAVVSRGYRREGSGLLVVSNGTVQCADASVAGDEPAQMAAKLSGVVVIVDEQRTRGASYAIEKFGANVIILDDGFQHRYLQRTVDVLVIPVSEIEHPGTLLPAGNRREPLSSIRRASLVALSRCETIAQFENARAIVRKWTDRPVIGLATRVAAFRRASTRFSVDIAGMKGKSVLAFSGIGTPGSFDHSLKGLGLDVKKHVSFPDHHHYRRDDLERLKHLMKEVGADYCVTTEKDVARLSAHKDDYQRFLEETPLFYLEIEHDLLAGEQELREGIDRL